MGRYRGAGLALWVLSVSSGAWAGDLGQRECFQAALKQSETLADQQEQILQAEEHCRQAIGSVLPNLGLAASYFKQASGAAGSPTDQTQVKFSLTQPLFQGLREFAALRQTREGIAYQQEARQWAGLQLYSDLALMFYTVLSLEKDLMHVDAQFALYEQRIRDLQARVRIGRSRPTEVMTVQSAQAILSAQRRQIQGQVVVARQGLAFLTGLSPDISLSDGEALPSAVDPEESYLDQLEKRPDVLAARKKMEAAEANIALARGARLPALVLSGDAYPVRPEPNADVRWDAQIALTLPLFQGGVLASKEREAESQYRQSELALKRLLRLDQEEIRNAWQTLQSDLAQVNALETAAVISHKNYQAILQDYNLGLVTNLDVLQALGTDQDTQRALDKTKYAARIDYHHLEAAAARRLDLLQGK